MNFYWHIALNIGVPNIVIRCYSRCISFVIGRIVKIPFFFSDEKTKRRIFNIHTSKMTLADDVNVEEYIMSKDDLSGADIKAICTEAGLMALR